MIYVVNISEKSITTCVQPVDLYRPTVARRCLFRSKFELVFCARVCRSKNKFLPKIQDWVKEHGGGA